MTRPRTERRPQPIETRRPKQGSRPQSHFVVTVRMDRFVTVNAHDEEQARSRGLDTAVEQWGAGCRPEVVEIEELA